MLDSSPVALPVARATRGHGLLVGLTVVYGGALVLATSVAIGMVLSPQSLPTRVSHAARAILMALPDGQTTAGAVLVIGVVPLVVLIAASLATARPIGTRRAPRRTVAPVQRPTARPAAAPAPRHELRGTSTARARRRARPVVLAAAILATLVIVAVTTVIALRAIPTTLSGPSADGAVMADGSALTPEVRAEVAYVQEHWSDRNIAEYGSLGDNDCANFASQALIARDWTPDDVWWHHGSGADQSYSTAWIGSTSMARWLSSHPDWAEPLTDAQRDEVEPGDLVQFDWDDSGNRDHTGIVTEVESTAAGVRIEYASHSNDRHDFTVDEALALDGGSAYYWHLTR